jgi:N-acetylneuraminate synthase
VPISITPAELKDLIDGSRAIFSALGGSKEILSDEKPTIDFAYASCVSIREIKKGEKLTMENVWVKRPGTGEIKAKDFDSLLGKIAKNNIPLNSQLKWTDFE